MVTNETLLSLLKDATPETIVLVRYRAGRPAGPQAMVEFAQSRDWDKRPTEYVGHFSSLRMTKRKELLLTLWVHNRGETGAFRAFNPSLGVLEEVRVLTN